MKPYTIVIADDHTLFRSAIRRLLESSDHIRVIGEAADGLELLELLSRVTPDLVTLGISIPNPGGLEAIPEIKTRFPRIKIMVLTMHLSETCLRDALSAGADGYLLKQDTQSDFLSALDQVIQGKRFISPAFGDLKAPGRAADAAKPAAPKKDPLTPRQKQVLKLVVEGKTSKQIASQLNISVKTVDHHRADMMARLNVKNRIELVNYALSQGYQNENEMH